MSTFKPCHTPVDASSKLSDFDGVVLPDGTHYCSYVGALQYLKFTRLDISYVVQQLCLFMHAPRDSHYSWHSSTWVAHFCHIFVIFINCLFGCIFGWIFGFPGVHSSFCNFLGDNLLSWLSYYFPLQCRSRI